MQPNYRALLIDEVPDALIATSAEGRILFWNGGAEQLFGYRRDEAEGQLLTELVVPEDRMHEEKSIAEQVLAEGVVKAEVVRRTKSGALLYLNVTARPVRDTAGALQCIVRSESDFTKLHLLRESRLMEERYGALLESTPDAIILLNDSGRIVLINGQTEAMFGYSRGEIIGQLIEALLPASFRATHASHRQQYFRAPRTRAMGPGLELHGRRRNGEEFPVEISLSPLRTDQGLLVMSAIRDITERKRFQRALQEKNVELERASQAKDRFLATMSHELRTPLNAILGFTGTLLMRLPGPLTSDQERQLSTVQRSAKHLLSLINDLLDLAKIESGQVEVTLEPVAVQDVLGEVYSSMKPAADQKGLALHVEVPATPCIVPADRRALSQILINLTANAIKFTKEGEIRLHLAERTDGNTTISVFDTGVGIRPEDRAQLFQAFSRLKTGTPRAEGTGLGLHLSQKLVALLGGTISFDSEYGKGSCFRVELPRSP